MGRPIAGRYRMPLRDKRGEAVVDAGMATMTIGDRLFRLPVVMGDTRRQLTPDAFWELMRDWDGVHVLDSEWRAYMKLTRPNGDVRVVRMSDPNPQTD